MLQSACAYSIGIPDFSSLLERFKQSGAHLITTMHNISSAASIFGVVTALCWSARRAFNFFMSQAPEVDKEENILQKMKSCNEPIIKFDEPGCQQKIDDFYDHNTLVKWGLMKLRTVAEMEDKRDAEKLSYTQQNYISEPVVNLYSYPLIMSDDEHTQKETGDINLHLPIKQLQDKYFDLFQQDKLPSCYTPNSAFSHSQHSINKEIEAADMIETRKKIYLWRAILVNKLDSLRKENQEGFKELAVNISTTINEKKKPLNPDDARIKYLEDLEKDIKQLQGLEQNDDIRKLGTAWDRKRNL